MSGSVLVFGANGQDGAYLVDVCRERGMNPIGISRSGPWVHCDITEAEGVAALFRKYQPAYAFNLAALSSTRHESLMENHRTICAGTLNFFEAARLHAPECRLLICGSGLQFENTGRPIKESDSFLAGSSYALARIHSAYAARYYRSLGLKTYVAYLFHHESPRRSEQFISMKIAGAAQRIAAGSGEILEVRDPSVLKEWTHAKDVVEGMVKLVGQDSVHEATIGSGRAHSIEEWIDTCFKLKNLRWTDHVRVGSKGTGGNCLVSDPETIMSLGWRPRIELVKLAEEMLQSGSS